MADEFNPWGNGSIAVYRKLLGKPIWQKSTPEQKVILITLLLMVNYYEEEWEWMGEKFRVMPGQKVTSLESIAKASGKGITIQNVRTALVKFEKYEFLTNISTKTGRLITIVNWQDYQPKKNETNKEDNKDLTKTSQTPNKDLTPNNNINKLNKVNKDIYTPEFETFWAIYPNKKEKVRAFNCWKARLKEEGCTVEDMQKAGENYALECKIEGTLPKYIKHGSTFLSKDKPFADYINWTPPTPKGPGPGSGKSKKTSFESENKFKDFSL